MTTRETTQSSPAVDTASPAAGLNLLGDENAGGCCGGSSCCSTAE